MSDTDAPTTEMPRYRSHKIVHALKIAAIEIGEDKSAKIAPADKGFAVFSTKPGWAERFTGTDEDPGYYVQYGDGFASWSPTKAFEEGYTAVGAAESHSASLFEIAERLAADVRDEVVDAVRHIESAAATLAGHGV